MVNKINVPFVDLGRQFRKLEAELIRIFQDIGRSGQYIMGEHLESFEQKAANYVGATHAIGVGNGTDALVLILKALGIGQGDEVITAANSFIATAGAIAAVGAKPVLVDVADDLNIDPARIVDAVSDRTKAIIPVHLTGRPAQMEKIQEIARRNQVFVLEDAAQAMGARLRSQRVGTFGLAAGFSLHPLKNLGVYGDGGLITTSDDELAARLRSLRNHGLRNRNECEMWGLNSRLDELQAAFAEIKLSYLDEWNKRCREIAKFYREELDGIVQVPNERPGEECVYHNFVIRAEEKHRDALIAHLARNGVGAAVHYPIPIHLQVAARPLGPAPGDNPNAERLAKTMISLPIYPELSDGEVECVARKVKEYFS